MKPVDNTFSILDDNLFEIDLPTPSLWNQLLHKEAMELIRVVFKSVQQCCSA